MRMKMNLAGLLAVGLLVSAPLGAQGADSKPFHVGGSLAYGFDQPYKTTNNHLAYSVELGYKVRIAGADAYFRPVLSANFFPGKEEAGLKTSLTGLQLAGDVLIATPVKGLHSVFGISFNKWTVKNTGTEIAGVTAFPITEDKGIKFGARIGLEYDVNESLAIFTTLQGIELGRSPKELVDLTSPSGGTNALAKGGQNVAILQFGAKFKF